MSQTLDGRIRGVLLRMLRYQEAPAQDCTKPVLCRLPSSSTTPVDTDPLALRWARRFERMVIAAERDAERYERTPRIPALGDRRSDAYRETNARILAFENQGVDPTWIAFWEGRTTRNVTELRANAGLDPQTGVKRPKPYTDVSGA